MTPITYALERPEDGPDIETLLDLCFGPDRTAKTAYRLREGVAPVRALCLVARAGAEMRASIRFWPIELGAGRTPALLLGPLAVDPDERGRGIGVALMKFALAEAERLGHRICVLVGDEPYYARVGFSRAAGAPLEIPGPVDLRRLLARELVPGALDGVAGMIQRPRMAA